MESRWGARISVPVQIGPGVHPASYTTGTGSFPGVKRPERGVHHPPLSSVEAKERVELYLYSSPAFVAYFRVTFTFTFIPAKLGVGLLIRLGVGRGFKPVGAKEFSLIHNVQTERGIHISSYFMCNTIPFGG